MNNPKYHLTYNYFVQKKVFGQNTLIQVGTMYTNPETEIVEHVQPNCIELTVVEFGEGYSYSMDNPFKIKEDDIFFSVPYETHKIISSKTKPLKFSFIAFHCENKVIQKEFYEIINNINIKTDRIFQEQRIHNLVSEIINEITNSSWGFEKIVENHINEIAYLTIRAFKEKQIPPTKNIASTKNINILCYQITNYIDRNIFNITSLQKLSKEFKYNYSYLSTIFKKNTGQTITDYFIRRKLTLAKSMILEGKMSITEIANTLNYSSIYAFSHSFKNEFGLNPTEYRKKHFDGQRR